MSTAASILHADLDAFFAAVEQRDDPGLRGRPVIVGPGVVLAASYEARAHGVRSAMGGVRARRLCPEAIVVSPRFSAYAQASRDVFAIFERTAPVVEAISIDEAFLDVSGLERISGTPEVIARRLRREVREQVGLPISIGLATTKHLAKVASNAAKPDGLLAIAPGEELAFLHLLPVGRIKTLPRPTAATATVLITLRALLAAERETIRRRRLTLLGISITNLERAETGVQLELPIDGQPPPALDVTLDAIRDRYGTTALQRATLLGRNDRRSAWLMPGDGPDGMPESR